MPTIPAVTARELMRTEIPTLPESAPVREAIAVFEDEHVTGIPVVDAAENVVGVLSEHDVARRDHVRGSRIETERGDYDMAEPDEDEPSVETAEFSSKEDYSPALLGEALVKDWMNPAVISVAPDAGLKTICETMRREGVHRVLVVEGGRLLGLVSSLDVVRYLARVL